MSEQETENQPVSDFLKTLAPGDSLHVRNRKQLVCIINSYSSTEQKKDVSFPSVWSGRLVSQVHLFGFSV